MNTDLTAWISYGGVKFQQPGRGDDLIMLGREEDWARGLVRLECGRRDGHYFANAHVGGH